MKLLHAARSLAGVALCAAAQKLLVVGLACLDEETPPPDTDDEHFSLGYQETEASLAMREATPVRREFRVVTGGSMNATRSTRR